MEKELEAGQDPKRRVYFLGPLQGWTLIKRWEGEGDREENISGCEGKRSFLNASGKHKHVSLDAA